MPIFKFLLALHIAGGTAGLLAGTYIMLAKKGNRRHQLIGKIFAISMLGAGACSLVLAVMHPNEFLFVVGIFTIYLVGTGWRYLYLKNFADGQKPQLIDWLLMAFMAAGSIIFVIIGMRNVLIQKYFGLVMLLFAWRAISFIIQDYSTYQGKIATKNYWLTFHLQRMMGAYIASLTAFAVVNAPSKLSFLPWLLPTVIVVPLIIKWTRQYTVKLKALQ